MDRTGKGRSPPRVNLRHVGSAEDFSLTETSRHRWQKCQPDGETAHLWLLYNQRVCAADYRRACTRRVARLVAGRSS